MTAPPLLLVPLFQAAKVSDLATGAVAVTVLVTAIGVKVDVSSVSVVGVNSRSLSCKLDGQRQR